MTQKTADYIRLDNEKRELLCFERSKTSSEVWNYLSARLVGSAFKITEE